MSEELQIYDPANTNDLLMKQLAEDDGSMQLSVNIDDMINKNKLFLIATAKKNFTRIIKLTNFLQKVEDKFIDNISSAIDDDALSLQQLSLVMETITNLLKDARETVVQITRDEKIQDIVINTTNIITPDGNTATIIDADSRDSIRNLASSLLKQFEVMENQIVDVESTEVAENSEGDETNV